MAENEARYNFREKSEDAVVRNVGFRVVWTGVNPGSTSEVLCDCEQETTSLSLSLICRLEMSKIPTTWSYYKE